MTNAMYRHVRIEYLGLKDAAFQSIGQTRKEIAARAGTPSCKASTDSPRRKGAKKAWGMCAPKRALSGALAPIANLSYESV